MRENTTMTSKLQHALALAAQGFWIFPIEAGVKSPPRIDDFPTKATRDEAQIRRWWTCPVMGFEQDFNIGISTSRFRRDETLLVVDSDNKGGKNGDQTIARLEVEGKVLPATFVVRTPSGGRHLVYSATAACRGSVGKIGEGIDIRAHGGYVVGAGSVVRAGEYIRASDQEVVPAPDWLILACGLREANTAADPRRAPNAVPQTLDPERAWCRVAAYLDRLLEVSEGERNHAAFRVANHAKDAGVPEDDCLALLRAHWKCSPALDDAELSVAIASAYKSTRTAFGSSSPEVQFAGMSTISGQSQKVDKTLFRRLLDFCRIL